MTSTKVVEIKINVPLKAKATLDRQARDRGCAPSLWANQIFDVGFAAICARERSMPITDGDLDAICAATLMLWAGPSWDTEAIAKALGVPEATVVRILDGWRQYRRGQELNERGV